MLKRNKTIAIILAFVFCMSFLAPAFFAPPVAEAASTAEVIEFSYETQKIDADLGVLQVKVKNFETRLSDMPWYATVSFPTSLTKNWTTMPSVGNTGTEDISVQVPTGDNAFQPGDVDLETAVGNFGYLGTFKIVVNGANGNLNKDGKFNIYFNSIDTRNFSGDVIVNIIAGDQPFQNMPGNKIATVNATGKTQAIAKSIAKITSTGGYLDNISIYDLVPGTIQAGGTITLEMKSKGFEFAAGPLSGTMPPTGRPAAISGYHRFDGGFNAGSYSVSGDDTITFVVPDESTEQLNGMVGLINAYVTVDEKVARVGQDIEVTVSGAGITKETLVVGQYVDYLVNVSLDKSTELIAGRSGSDDQYLGSFFIEEVAPGTLVEDRSILLELPAGVEWNEDETDFGPTSYEVVNNSSIQLECVDYIDQRTMKLNVVTGSGSADEGAKILISGLAVDVSPEFRGDIDLKVSGKAGVEGVVAGISKVIPMITMEASTPDLMLGLKEQKVSDVIITESKADAIIDREGIASWEGITETALKFYLDDGFRFSKVPKVEVLEGDMVLEVSDVKITSPRGGQNLLIVPVRAGSYKTPAKIKISDIYVTADRTAPTGAVTLYAADLASDWNGAAFFSSYGNAFNNCYDIDNDSIRFAYDIPAKVDVANNATEPPVENVGTGTATFVIDSNLYTVNGVTRVMEVAPYIKNDRTYVPYRYLAYALGVAEADIVWDETAQTVTVTKGDNVVVATIGSTTLTVNGEAQTIEVAPEIKDGRTMLPARFLAEALGATVGWDPATRTVVIEN